MKYTHMIFAMDDHIDRDKAWNLLNDTCEAKPLSGGYIMADTGECVHEPSYLVPFTEEAWDMVRLLGAGQESVLLLSEMHAKPALRKATLRFSDPNMPDVDLGWMQQHPEDASTLEQIAAEFGGYSMTPDGAVFVACERIL